MKNKKAFTVWKRSLRKIQPDRLREMRNELGIPEKGFSDDDSQKKWEEEERANVKAIDKVRDAENDYLAFRDTAFAKQYAFIDEIKRECKELQYGFDKAIEELINFDNVADLTIENSNATGCKFEYFGGHKRDMEEGVYIRVGPDSTLSDVRQFLSINSHMFKVWQDIFYKNHTKKRLKSEQFDRNNLIYSLSEYSLSEIKDVYRDNFGNDDIEFVRRKDTVAVMLLNRFGLNVTEDNFRKIAERVRRRNSSV